MTSKTVSQYVNRLSRRAPYWPRPVTPTGATRRLANPWYCILIQPVGLGALAQRLTGCDVSLRYWVCSLTCVQPITTVFKKKWHVAWRKCICGVGWLITLMPKTFCFYSMAQTSRQVRVVKMPLTMSTLRTMPCLKKCVTCPMVLKKNKSLHR